jgi:HPt (histidine-containing phosphotransfer) domain-containing protein
MNDFVPKPVVPSVLFATLLKWLLRMGGPRRGDAGQSSVPAPGPGDSAAAPDPCGAVLARLGKLPGLDLARGMSMVRGNRGKYLDFLRRFLDGHRGDPDGLREHLEAGDDEAARNLAHGLKGVAGTLGVAAVAEAAAELDATLRPGVTNGTERISALIAEIEQSLATLAAVLERDK